MLAYKRIGITVKRSLDQKDEAVAHVLSILKKTGAEIFADPERMKDVSCMKGLPDIPAAHDIDLLIVIGGDGTILRAVREVADCAVPVLSVNRGAVGFLAEMNIDEAAEILPPLLKGKGIVEERQLLEVKATRGSETLLEGLALNDAVIAQGAISRLLDLRADINGETMATFHADGLIIATPTGSTAYSLAAGGPIVHPRLDAIILTPINPHSFSQKPIVIPGDSKIEIEVLSREHQMTNNEVSLTLDGQVYERLQPGDHITIAVHDQTAKFVRRSQDTFFATIRTKLKWGERLED